MLHVQRWLVAVGILLCAVGCFQQGPLGRGGKPKAYLYEVLRKADRLVVQDVRSWEGGDEKKLPSHEIRGVEKIADLLRVVELKEPEPDLRCKCDGQFWLTFYEGEVKLAKIEYHHDSWLQWREWSGGARLTEPARTAVPAWFEAEGYSVMRRERERDEERRKTREP